MSWEKLNFGPCPVSEIAHFIHVLKDGTEIALKIWLPCAKQDILTSFSMFGEENTFKWTTEIYPGSNKHENDKNISYPTILEYIPYGKDSTITLKRDHNRHPWFCSHGFIDIRVDIRGSGASSGSYYDEYTEQELADAVELIEWLSLQPWSNGRVGMYGKSWGGFNGLQVSCKQPEALKTVITLYSTDDRFEDDVHYQGDCIVGDQMLSWASAMFAYNARPPHPRYFPDTSSWENFWLTRLESSGNSFLTTWMQHQHKEDPYWMHGSVLKCENKIQCPVLVIGGHADGYSNAAYRMAATLNQDSRVVIGPWAHQWPDVSVAGPNIDHLGLCLKWWNYHLKDEEDENVTSWPRLALYIRDSMKPDEIVGSPTGTWVKIDDWNNRFNNFVKYSHFQTCPDDLVCFYFGPSMSLQFDRHLTSVPPVKLVPHALQGAGSGSWFSIDSGFAEDQTVANQYSCCWTSHTLEKDIVFSGLGKMYVCLQAGASGKYAINVRVTDEFPSGESTLISRGCQNLCVSSDGWVTKIQADREIIACVKLDGIGQKIKKGHKLNVAITPTCFPLLYPAIDNETLTVFPSKCQVVFQTADETILKDSFSFQPPKPLLELPCNEIKAGFYSTQRSVNDGKYSFEIHEDSGVTIFPLMEFEYGENVKETYVTDEKVTCSNISAVRTNTSVFHLKDGNKIKANVEATMTMTGDKHCFKVKENLRVFIDNTKVFEKSFDNTIPRIYV